MRGLLLTGGILFAASGAHAYEATGSRVTQAGKPVLISGHSSVVNNGCLTKPASITVTQQPEHGSLRTAVGSSQIKGGPGIIDKCIGLSGPGMNVTYVPSSGFSGVDQFRYTVSFPKTDGSASTRDFYYRVQGRPNGAGNARSGWTPAR